MALGRVLVAVREALGENPGGMVESGWRPVGGVSGETLDEGRLPEIRRRCAEVWQVEPALRRVEELLGHGALGRGLDGPRSEDAELHVVLRESWEDADNQRALFGRRALRGVNLGWLVDGEVFYAVHAGPLDALVKVARVAAGEVEGVVPSPEDWTRPVAYRRSVRRREYDAGTGSWRDVGARGHEHLADAREMWRSGGPGDDVADFLALVGARGDVSMVHVPVNTLGLRGVPELWRALDWAEAHGLSLSSMVDLAQALGTLAWTARVESKSADAVAAAGSIYSDPRPGAGSVLSHGPSVRYEPVSAPTGGVQNVEDAARQSLLEMVRSFGFGEHWFADASTGNLATAAAMELPAIWAIESRQEELGDLCRAVLDVAVERAVRAGRLSRGKHVYTLDFPTAAARDAGVVASLLTAVVGCGAAGVIPPRVASEQCLMALQVEDVPGTLSGMYAPGEGLKGEVQLPAGPGVPGVADGG